MKTTTIGTWLVVLIALVWAVAGFAERSIGADPGLTIDATALDRLVFVANRSSADITVIDTDTDKVLGQLAVAAVPHQYVLSESQTKLIASHLDEQALTIFDLATMGIEAVIDLGFAPALIALDPDGGTVAVSNPDANAVALVDLATAQIGPRIALADPSDLMFSRDGDLLLVASATSRELAVVEVASGTLLDPITVEGATGPGVVALTRTPGGKVGLALHGAGGEVSVLDLEAQSQVALVHLPGPATQAYPTANSQHFLIPNAQDQSVSLISSWTFGETDRLPGATDVTGINTGMFDTVAFVLSPTEDKAVILGLEYRRKLGEIALPSRPETGVSAAAGTKLYVALSGSDRVAVIDMRTRELTTMIDRVGRRPWGVNLAGGLSYCH